MISTINDFERFISELRDVKIDFETRLRIDKYLSKIATYSEMLKDYVREARRKFYY